jgi:hypothetical protein
MLKIITLQAYLNNAYSYRYKLKCFPRKVKNEFAFVCNLKFSY